MKKIFLALVAVIMLAIFSPTSSNAGSRYCKRTTTTYVFRICKDEKGNIISKEVEVFVETKYVLCSKPKE